MTTPDPARLVQLLTDAGFAQIDMGPDFRAFDWPDRGRFHRETLVLYGDPSNLADVLADLHAAADVGRKAQRVLDGLEAEATT